MTAKLRLAAGGTALALGLCVLSTTTAAPPLSNDTYKKATEADISTLQKLLNGGKPDKRAGGTIKADALLIAAYADAAGDKALRDQAVKVADAAAKKDWGTADTLAKGLKAGAGGSKGPGGIHKNSKLDLDDVMSPYRIGKSGGLNMEKDLKDAMKSGTMDPKAAELWGARSSVLAEWTKELPNQKAGTNKANKDKWEKYSKEMLDLSEQIAAEGAKGNGKTGPLFKKLDGTCVNCHNDFRD